MHMNGFQSVSEIGVYHLESYGTSNALRMVMIR